MLRIIIIKIELLPWSYVYITKAYIFSSWNVIKLNIKNISKNRMYKIFKNLFVHMFACWIGKYATGG